MASVSANLKQSNFIQAYLFVESLRRVNNLSCRAIGDSSFCSSNKLTIPTFYKTIMKYLFIAFIFFACSDISHFNNPPEVSTEPLDTINASPARIDAKPVFFESAFIKGTSEKRNGASVSFYGVTIGKLKIKSGR